MNQCDRLKCILQENGLKQKQLAIELGISESYISKLLKDPSIRLSQSVATLIEEKYGYHVDWILKGKEPKLKQISKNKKLSELHQKAFTQLEKMTNEEIRAVLAFINSLDEIEKSFFFKKTQSNSKDIEIEQLRRENAHLQKLLAQERRIAQCLESQRCRIGYRTKSE